MRETQNQKRSWALIFQAAAKLRDYGFSLGKSNIDKLTTAQERVLQVVYQHSPQGIMLKDIAKCVGLTPGAVSQIIEVLVKEEMVERTSDANDRRAVNIHISEKWEGVRQQVIAIFDREMEDVLMRKTTKERDAFVSILEEIIAKMGRSTNESVRRHSGETILAMEEYQ